MTYEEIQNSGMHLHNLSDKLRALQMPYNEINIGYDTDYHSLSITNAKDARLVLDICAIIVWKQMAGIIDDLEDVGITAIPYVDAYEKYNEAVELLKASEND